MSPGFKLNFPAQYIKKTVIILRWIALLGQLFTVYIAHFYFQFELPIIYCSLTIFCGGITNIFIQFNIIYLPVFYIIIALMTILIIIGLPWVNPLFKYPDQLKNIVEWNYFLLMIVFYIPLSLLFYQLGDKIKTFKF